MLQVLAERVEDACSDTVMQARAKQVAASIAKGWGGVEEAADILLAAPNPWPKLKQAGVV